MEGVIFDFNGTLFFDTDFHILAWQDMAKKLSGKILTREEFLNNLCGTTNKLAAEYCIGRTISDEEAKEIAQEKDEAYRQMCLAHPDKMVFAPGAEDLFKFLIEHKIPMTIATSSEIKDVEFFIKHFHLEKWFDISKIVYNQGKYPGKPYPFVYNNAAEAIGVNPEKCVVFEDAINGVDAARRAGISQIYVLSSEERRHIFEKTPGVTKVIKDFTEFDRSVFKI